MKQILLLTIVAFELLSSVIKSPILSVNNENQTLSIKAEGVDVGISGLVVHSIGEGHTAVLKNVVVTSYDKSTKIATLSMSDFKTIYNPALPRGTYKVEVGDIVELTSGYSRAVLIAPNEEIYYKITRSVKVQWIHPDIFASIISYNGHPTPLKSDFTTIGNDVSVGLVFMYLDKNLYTVDIKSFKILNVTELNLDAKEIKLPFYSRLVKIDANWWGEGSARLEEYEPYYLKLLQEYNKDNKQVQDSIKSLTKEN